LIPRGSAAVFGHLIAVAAFLSAETLQAQVGLSSGLAQVVLVARSAPHGSIGSVGAAVERANQGSIREVLVPVRISCNSSYRLTVIRTDVVDSSSSKIWVRSAGGEFQRLERGASVLVVQRGNSGGGNVDVQYRMEKGSGSGGIQAPPVRYELAITPQL
jgi:hypothetical protein